MKGGGRGQRRAKRTCQTVREQWRCSRKSYQPSETVTLAQLEPWLKPNLAQNDVVGHLVKDVLCTKSARIAEAIQEIVRLGLAGPDWGNAASRGGTHVCWGKSISSAMAHLLLASGSSQTRDR